MSRRKARLIECNNFHYTQYYNLYINKKPLLNTKLKKQNAFFYNYSTVNLNNKESLK